VLLIYNPPAQILIQVNITLQLASGDATLYTLLVPTDAAFAKVPQADIDAVTGNASKLLDMLRYHMISGVHTSHSFPFGRHLFFNSTNGHVIRVYRSAVGLSLRCSELTKTFLFSFAFYTCVVDLDVGVEC